MKTLNDIRKSFLVYFKQKDHEVVESSSLIPNNDPSLFFTNSGMVQFKDIFTGKEKRLYSKATTAQKCLRVSGKHNDLENVGYTARHHTFFEMLGNFSFGNYFKEEAIYYSWEFVTKNLALSKDKLYFTIYSEDEEAFKLWKKISGFSDSKIIRISTADNFWSMGDTGPCGPCSEIFYDHGENIKGGPPGSSNADGDRFIEIWNLVFMQYEKNEEGRILLPKPSIDTGMGLERISAIIQGKNNNYDIDLFQKLIQHSIELTGQKKPFHTHCVIADHIRASSFLIIDGIYPSNEGRGYVLRRIIRRAVRHIYQLGRKEPIFHKLVKTLTECMGESYPELIQLKEIIETTIRLEEQRFLETLIKGIKLLEQELENNNTQLFSGKTTFSLYDTYGFPIDLTADILKEHKKEIDYVEYESYMKDQKERSKLSWTGSGEVANQKIWFDLHEKFGSTEFIGYLYTKSQGIVQALIVNKQCVEHVEHNNEVIIVTNQTPFYGESGGQLGDHGVIESKENARIEIYDTQKFAPGIIAHLGKVIQGNIHVNDSVEMHINEIRRNKLKHAHSATHLLHSALRQIIGSHVTQKGSLVDEDKLRFDFNHLTNLSHKEIHQIEYLVNKNILQAIPVKTEILTLEEAKKKGAMALFGEKYSDLVRVVAIGTEGFSIEFCGGTHVSNTGEIGLFKIISESSIASGIRRIEAITGEAIINKIYEMERIKNQIENENVEKIKKLNKEILKLQQNLFMVDLTSDFEEINGIKIYKKHFDNIDQKAIRMALNDTLLKVKSAIIIFSTTCDDKVACIIGVSKDLLDRYDARRLAEQASKILGGTGGGGQSHIAQAGGIHREKINKLTDIFIN